MEILQLRCLRRAAAAIMTPFQVKAHMEVGVNQALPGIDEQ